MDVTWSGGQGVWLQKGGARDSNRDEMIVDRDIDEEVWKMLNTKNLNKDS